jgi:hypothetical protein
MQLPRCVHLFSVLNFQTHTLPPGIMNLGLVDSVGFKPEKSWNRIYPRLRFLLHRFIETKNKTKDSRVFRAIPFFPLTKRIDPLILRIDLLNQRFDLLDSHFHPLIRDNSIFV